NVVRNDLQMFTTQAMAQALQLHKIQNPNGLSTHTIGTTSREHAAQETLSERFWEDFDGSKWEKVGEVSSGHYLGGRHTAGASDHTENMVFKGDNGRYAILTKGYHAITVGTRELHRDSQKLVVYMQGEPTQPQVVSLRTLMAFYTTNPQALDGFSNQRLT